MADQFHYATDADGIATITWDQPGTSMNVMNGEAFAELGTLEPLKSLEDAIFGLFGDGVSLISKMESKADFLEVPEL